jgi:hypothetical protein
VSKTSATANKVHRDEIPARMKRAVRQRCGFGCVMCGSPVYVYEHMEDWAKVLKHEEENITLLCPTDHQDKTNKRLPLKTLQEANANPFNLQKGHSTPRFYHFGSERPTVILGTTRFTPPDRDFAAFVIDGMPMVGFRFGDGQALLQLRLFDATNKLVLQIADSELVYSVGLWDIEFVGSVLTVRADSQEILLRAKFSPEDNSITIDRGTLQFNGIEVEIWPEVLAVLNTQNAFSGGMLVAPIGLVIGQNSKLLAKQSLLHVPVEGSREVDRAEAKKWLAAHRK